MKTRIKVTTAAATLLLLSSMMLGSPGKARANGVGGLFVVLPPVVAAGTALSGAGLGSISYFSEYEGWPTATARLPIGILFDYRQDRRSKFFLGNPKFWDRNVHFWPRAELYYELGYTFFFTQSLVLRSTLPVVTRRLGGGRFDFSDPHAYLKGFSIQPIVSAGVIHVMDHEVVGGIVGVGAAVQVGIVRFGIVGEFIIGDENIRRGLGIARITPMLSVFL